MTEEQSGQICLMSTFLGKSRKYFFPKYNQKYDVSFKDPKFLYRDIISFLLTRKVLKIFNYPKFFTDILFIPLNLISSKKYQVYTKSGLFFK